MPKGLKCPVCERFTVHPLTTNWRQCSNCRTKMPEKGILVVLRKNKPRVLLRKSKTLEKVVLSKERTMAQKRVTMPDFQKSEMLYHIHGQSVYYEDLSCYGAYESEQVAQERVAKKKLSHVKFEIVLVSRGAQCNAARWLPYLKY